MRTTPFLAFILILTIGWLQLYASVRETFNGVAEYRAQVENLREEMNQISMARDFDRDQFLEFRQVVATLMPDILKEKGEGEKGYPYRALASVINKKESEKVRGLLAKTLFERGKEHFRKNEFAKSNRAFQQLIDRYSYTPYVTESYFLLAEGHFKQNELEECTRVIQHMIELFPQAELTGFALIRLGRIYQIQNRNEEAVDIYKTVMRTYPQREVASQAKANLRGLDL